MGTLQGEWNHIQWQLDPCRWYLHSNTLYRRGRRSYDENYKLLPQKYEKRYCSRLLRYIINEGMLGFMIFLVICLTLYMHTFMLDNSKNFHLPTEAKIEYREKASVMLAIVMHSPSIFLETTMTSLNASQHEANVFVFRNFVGEDVFGNVSRWFPAATVVSDKDRFKTTSIVKFVMDRFIFSNYDVLVYINSYSALSAKWWDILMEGLDRADGVFSLYGMERDTEELEKCDYLFCSQTWMGWVGSVWRRNLATRMLSETAKVKGNFQYKMENWCKLKKIPMHMMKYSAITNVFDNGKRRSQREVPRGQWVESQPHHYVREASVRNTSNIDMESKERQQSSADQQSSSSICIAAVIRVRIYREDEAKMTSFELEQWIRYMQFAGADVVYLYDAFEKEDEKLYAWVREIFEPDEVVYHSWYFNGTYDIQESFMSAYRHATRKYKFNCAWHIHADINEYPFLTYDTEKDFLKRLVAKIRALKKNINELSFPSIRFLGNQTTDPLLIGRLQSRYQKRINGEARPLFLASSVKKTHFFHNKLQSGETIYLDPNYVRMNSFSLINNGTPSSNKIVPDNSMFSLYINMKQLNFISNKLPLYATNQFWDS